MGSGRGFKAGGDLATLALETGAADVGLAWSMGRASWGRLWRRVSGGLLWSLWLLAAVVLVLCVVAQASSATVDRGAGLTPRGSALVSAGGSLSSLAASVSSIAATDDPAYAVSVRDGEAATTNPDQRFAIRFRAGAVQLRTGRSALALRLWGFGPLGSVRPVGIATPRVRANRVTYRYPGLTEWYANEPTGLEQGFVVPSRPVGDRGGQLLLAFTVGGNVHGSDSRARVVFHGVHGSSIAYRDLTAYDARGRRLAATMTLRGGRLQIRIDARRARFPVRIDPLFQETTTLVPSDDVSEYGSSVAISANGTTALVGSYAANNYAGAVWVFTRSGSEWVQQGSELTPSDAIGDSNFGLSVALSANGDTALIGGANDDDQTGAAWVFTRSGSTWTQQGPKLVPSDVPEYANFGTRVALSSDGDTALIGAPGIGVGAAWVFTRSGVTWTQQGAALTGAGETGESEFGSAVALSADGSTALVGAQNYNEGNGAAWVFTRSESTWTQQGTALTPSDSNVPGTGFFGTAVALSADGDTALIGANGDDGSAWVFTRSQSAWTQQGSGLTPGDAAPGAEFGGSVALSADGNTALVGAANDNDYTGAAWIFTQSAGTWAQQGSKIVPIDATGRATFGSSVAISGDATTAVIGAPLDNSTGSVTMLNEPVSMDVPSVIDFGPQTIGVPGVTQSVQVQNSGTTPLSFSGPAYITGPNSTDFMIPPDDDQCDGQIVAAGQTCQISIQFTASMVGSESATLNFGTNDTYPASTATVALTGTGSPLPASTVHPSTGTSTSSSTSVGQPTATPAAPSANPTTPSRNDTPPRSPIGPGTCSVTQQYHHLDVRCTVAHALARNHVYVAVRHDSTTIAAGRATVHGRSIIAALPARRHQRPHTSVSVTIAIVTASHPLDIHATIHIS